MIQQRFRLLSKLNIDKKLNTKKSKKGWIWLSSFALMLLISATLVWTLNTDETTNSTNLTSQNLNLENKNTSVYSSTNTEHNDGAAIIKS
jgi:hypothetical protein